MFEFENQITDILEYYGQTKTVNDIKKLESFLSALKFAVETIIYLHIMTCSQIILCTHRDYS